LHQIGQVAVEDALQRLTQGRMIPPDRKNAKTAQQIKIARAITIEQVLTLALLKAHIVTDRLQDPYQLLIQVARMHGTALRLAVHKHLGNV
jgi:hypothetical protein